MVNAAPAYSVGDLVSPLSQSLVLTYKVQTAPIAKGAPVVLHATNITDGSVPGQVLTTTTAQDGTVIGIATDSDAGTPNVVPVCQHGIVVCTATAAAIAQGSGVSSSGTAGSIMAVAASTTVAITYGLLNSVIGYAISNFTSAGDQGYVFVTK